MVNCTNDMTSAFIVKVKIEGVDLVYAVGCLGSDFEACIFVLKSS